MKRLFSIENTFTSNIGKDLKRKELELEIKWMAFYWNLVLDMRLIPVSFKDHSPLLWVWSRKKTTKTKKK